MSATVGAVIVVSLLTLFFVVVVGWLLWSSRISHRGDSAEAVYRRNSAHLHSPRNRRAMKAKERRNMWAAGSVGGAAGIGFIGTGGSDHGGCGAGGCGGAGCGGGGGGCGGS
jgi:hypothetical protein